MKKMKILILCIIVILLVILSVSISTENNIIENDIETPVEAPIENETINNIVEQPDGTVIVVGRLEWIDLEGGFYAITKDSQNIAVISNFNDFKEDLNKAKDNIVQIHGVWYDGVSIRMAGREIVIDSIQKH